MFTGIVQTQAEVILANNANDLARIVVSVKDSFASNIKLGASIAINGVCLTVVKEEKYGTHSHIAFDVIEETLTTTNLSSVCVGSIINYERSLKIGDEIGGHIVSGHVHCQASLVKKLATEENCALFFEIDPHWVKYILPKGFITINGVSLTVREVTRNRFSVHLIPETLARTNLSLLTLNDQVNIECDQQTITIVTTIERMKDRI